MDASNGSNDERRVAGTDGSGAESSGRARNESFSQQSQSSQTAAE
jgi:hypothetical protein